MHDLECAEILECFADVDQFRYRRACLFNRAGGKSLFYGFWAKWDVFV